MATTPTPIAAPIKKKRAVAAAKHTITLTFEDKFASLYDQLTEAAEADDRTVSQYVLLFLRKNHAGPTE